MIRDGRNTDGMRRTSTRLRHASPGRHPEAVPHERPRQAVQEGPVAGRQRHRDQQQHHPEADQGGARLHADDHLVAHRLHQVRDRVGVGHRPEPAGHGLPREEGRREEEQREERGGSCPARPRTSPCGAPGSRRARSRPPTAGRPAAAGAARRPRRPAPARRTPGRSLRNRTVWTIASMTPPTRRPVRMATRDTGDATRRSKKPPSMSSAKAAPAVVPPIRMPWRMAPATAKSRNPRTGGKPGMPARGARRTTPVKIAISTSGKKRLGKSAWGVRSVSDERPARRAPPVWTAASLTRGTGAAAASSAPSASRRRPVLATNTSSRLRLGQVQPGHLDARLVERAHHAGEGRGPVGQPQRQMPLAGGERLARTAPARRSRRSRSSARRRASTRQRSGRRPAPSSSRGRALGHDLPAVDDPHPRRRAGRPPPGTGW